MDEQPDRSDLMPEGRRLEITPLDAASGSASLQIVPGADLDTARTMSRHWTFYAQTQSWPEVIASAILSPLALIASKVLGRGVSIWVRDNGRFRPIVLERKWPA